MMNEIVNIGIDFGIKNCVVAILDGPQPRVLDNRDLKSKTPAVVGIKKRKGKNGTYTSEILVGGAAVCNQPIAPKDTIVSVRRLMGRAVSDPEVQKIRESLQYDIVEPSDGTRDSVRVVMGGKEYSPVDISAMILRKLKEDAEFRLGKEVTHAVITVPAYFSEIQRKATRKAGLKAGMKIIKILDEPTAVAIAFGIDSKEDAEPKRLLVYDLGGGTFDICVLLWAANAFAQLNLEGDMWLGGDNFDQKIIDHVVKYVRKEFEVEPTSNARFMAALKIAAQKAKERLTSARSANVIVPNLLQSNAELIDVDIEITREEFERMIKPVVDKTVQLTKKALEKAELTGDQVDYVYLVGSSTRIPLIQKTLGDMFGTEKVLCHINPEYCVAMGATIVSTRPVYIVCPDCNHFLDIQEASHCPICGASFEAEKEAQKTQVENDIIIEVEDDVDIGGVAPFHYGTQSARDEFNVFIHKNDPYETPVEMRKTVSFYTQIPNQRMIRIPVYGGDHLDKASLNEKQGEAFAVLPQNLPKGTEVHIKIWLDKDGIIDLEAYLEDGTALKPWKLEGEADQKVVEELQKIEQMHVMVGSKLYSEQVERIEEIKRSAYENMREHNFENVLRLTQKAETLIRQGILCRPRDVNIDHDKTDFKLY